MKRLSFSMLLLCFISAAAFAQTPAPTANPTPKRAAPDEDVVKISTTLIQVDVTVTDKTGKIVTDLKPEDFEVFENSQPQEITNFSFVAGASEAASASPSPSPKNNSKNAVPLPPAAALRPEQVRRTISLVVDDLTLSFESVYYVRRALKKFVDEQMRDGDLVAIIRTGGGIGALQQFTSDRRQLYAAIEKVRWNPAGNGKIGAFAPMEATPLQRAKSMGAEISDEQLKAEKDSMQSRNDFQSSLFATGTLGALNFIVRGMKDLPGRKSVMLMSDGFKLYTKDESGFVDNSRILESLRRLTDLANRSSVVVYTMDARGLQTLGLTAADSTSGQTADQVEANLSDRRSELFDTQDGLRYLAQQTGGISIVNNNDLNLGISRMLNDQKGYYLIGYAPDAETFDAKTRRFNRLNIKVKRPDLKIRYRSGFFGVSDEDATAQPVKQTAAQQITTALTSPFAANDINLRLNTLYGNDAKNGAFIRSLLHVDAADLKFTDEPGGNHKTSFDVLAISFGENGVVVDQISRTYTLSVKKEGFDELLRGGFVYNFVFPVKKAGAYQLRVALRDNASEKVGSANQFVEVPNLKKVGLTLSGIVLENLTEKQFQASQSGAVASPDSTESKSTLQSDTSLRRFKRGTILRYGFEIYNVRLDSAQKPQLLRQIRVFRDGKLLLDGKQSSLEVVAQPSANQFSTAGALNLGREMQPGDYILQIVVTDNLAKDKRKIAAQFVQFEIVE